jgi:hypothetical protein
MKTRRYNGTGSARSAIMGLLYTLLHTTLYLALRALQRQLTIFNGGIASIGRAVNNLLPRRSVSSMICRRHGAGKSEFTIQPLTIQDGRQPTSNRLYVAAFHYVRHRQHTTTDSWPFKIHVWKGSYLLRIPRLPTGSRRPTALHYRRSHKLLQKQPQG